MADTARQEGAVAYAAALSMSAQWWAREDLVDMAKTYALAVGYVKGHGGYIRNRHGMLICRGWDGLVTRMFRDRLVDWVEWEDGWVYGFPLVRRRKIRRYFFRSV